MKYGCFTGLKAKSLNFYLFNWKRKMELNRSIDKTNLEVRAAAPLGGDTTPVCVEVEYF